MAVIGIGNVLAGDDGVGPTVVRTFEARWSVPEDVEVIDAGTPGLDLTAYLVALDAALIVDAIKAAGPAGALRRHDAAALRTRPPVLAMGPHDPGVREAILATELHRGSPPDVRLLGVIPARLETGVGLSPPVRAAVPALVEELRLLGVPVAERVPPAAPDLWWERGR